MCAQSLPRGFRAPHTHRHAHMCMHNTWVYTCTHVPTHGTLMCTPTRVMLMGTHVHTHMHVCSVHTQMHVTCVCTHGCTHTHKHTDWAVGPCGPPCGHPPGPGLSWLGLSWPSPGAHRVGPTAGAACPRLSARVEETAPSCQLSGCWGLPETGSQQNPELMVFPQGCGHPSTCWSDPAWSLHPRLAARPAGPAPARAQPCSRGGRSDGPSSPQPSKRHAVAVCAVTLGGVCVGLVILSLVPGCPGIGPWSSRPWSCCRAVWRDDRAACPRASGQCPPGRRVAGGALGS